MKEIESSEELVSIIMPAYNCEDYIKNALDSVLMQTYKNWELLIIDDCSEDNTEEIIKKYDDSDFRINYYKLKKNSGAAVARNTGIKLAKGKYIAFLDSDDLWEKEKLMKQINFMSINGYSFTCTNYSKINDQGKHLNKVIKSKTKSDYNGILKTCPGNSTVIYNVDEIGKVLIPNIKKRNDYVMWLKVIKKTDYLYGLNETLGSHRIRTGSISKNKFDLVKYHWYVYRKIESISFFKSSYLVLYWIFYTVLKLR